MNNNNIINNIYILNLYIYLFQNTPKYYIRLKMKKINSISSINITKLKGDLEERKLISPRIN